MGVGLFPGGWMIDELHGNFVCDSFWLKTGKSCQHLELLAEAG